MSALGREARWLAATVRDGLRLFRLAPVIPLIAILPEAAQHVVEVRLGMFESRAAFAAHALDPLRLGFGNAKVVGLWIALLLAARVWVNLREGARWWSLGTIAWRPLLIALVLFLVTSLPMTPGLGLPTGWFIAINAIVMVLTLPLLTLTMAGLLGDRAATLGSAYRHGWGRGLRIVALTLLCAVPVMALHQANHLIAIGQPAPIVWLAMAWDSLVVGALACLLGTALHHGYSGPGPAPSFTRA